MTFNINELFADSGDLGEMMDSKGYKTLYKHICEAIYQKNNQISDCVFALVAQDTQELRNQIVELKAEIKALASFYSITENVIASAIQVREQRDKVVEPTEETNGPRLQVVSR